MRQAGNPPFSASCADGVDRPMVRLPVRDQGSDADDRVVGVLRKLVADRLADLHVGLADEVVGGREPTEVGHSLQVPDDDAWLHAGRSVTQPLGVEKDVLSISRAFHRGVARLVQGAELPADRYVAVVDPVVATPVVAHQADAPDVPESRRRRRSPRE